MALTAMQEKFKNEYILLLLKDKPNATEAAKRAGYSKKTAYSQGQRLLKNVEIDEAIKKALQKSTSKFELTVESILQDIVDTRDVVASRMPKAEDKDVSSLANARAKQNDMLARHLGMFVEKVEHSGSTNVTIVNDL